jgi:RNA polymerase sigma-70 factor (ECF subfamily)
MVQPISDDEAIRRVRGGDTRSYEILASRYFRPLHRIAWRFLRNNADAEDAVQRAHLLALTHIDQYAGRSGYLSWMYSIVVNEARTQMRKAWRLVNGEDAYMERLSSSMRNPEQQAFDRDFEHLLERAVETLPSAFQPVFRLREMEELSTAETGQRLGLTDACVKSRLFRARSLLRKRLKSAPNELPIFRQLRGTRRPLSAHSRLGS